MPAIKMILQCGLLSGKLEKSRNFWKGLERSGLGSWMLAYREVISQLCLFYFCTMDLHVKLHAGARITTDTRTQHPQGVSRPRSSWLVF